MALTTSLKGRVRNTNLPKSHALLPLLEAVVNSIQAVDARFSNEGERGRIVIRIERSLQGQFDLGLAGPGRTPLKAITGFAVEDNGVGFTVENMDSFEARGHRLQGRARLPGSGSPPLAEGVRQGRRQQRLRGR